jgi:hypothetical protein
VAVLLRDGLVLIAGGYSTSTQVATAELFDPAAGTFTPTGSMTQARAHATATLLPDGKVLVAGGWKVSSPLSSAELYDPASGTFSSTGSMLHPRTNHTATLLGDGRVLIVGGIGDAATPASAEVYDPDTGTFTATGSLATGRSYHTATLLLNGRVLIAGGLNNSCGAYHNCASAEVYDPATGLFTATGSMAHGRTEHTASLLPDGRVLIAGGAVYIASVKEAELYDPAAGTFSPAGNMSGQGRHNLTATVLPGGRVALIGGAAVTGSTGGSPGLTSVELYSAGGFAVGAPLHQARSNHTATLLPDGRILVVGGEVGETVLKSVEIGWP